MTSPNPATAAHGEDGHAPARYAVFRAAYYGHDVPHHAIFVQITEKCGHLIHVRGPTSRALVFTVETHASHPSDELPCLHIQQVGWVSQENLPALQLVCATISPPEPQWDGSGRVEGARNSQDWFNHAVCALRQAHVLQNFSEEGDGEGPQLVPHQHPSA